MELPRPERYRQFARLAGLAAVYAVAERIMLAPIFNFGAIGSAVYQGDARLVAWALAWDNRAVLSRASLFDANIFHPERGALAYGEHFFGISLFSLPVYAVTRNPALGYNLVWLLSYALAAVAAHYVAWRLTRDHLASLVAGLSFAFCFFRMHHGHGHLHLIWVFWIPLSLVALQRWLTTLSWRAPALWTAMLVLQALASWYQAVMIFVADTLLAAWLVVLEPMLDRHWSMTRQRASRLLVQAVVAAAAALLIVWPFARHYTVLGSAENGRSAAVTSNGPVEAAAASADLSAFFVPPENTFIGRWLIRRGVKGPRWIWGELTLYLGWIAVALAAIGSAAAIAGRAAWARPMRFYILLGIVAAALAVGPSSREIAANTWGWSAFGLLARLPGADLFRAPARFASLLSLSLAMLASAGCAFLHERFGGLGRMATLAAVPLLLLEFYVVDFPSGPPPPVRVPAAYRSIAGLPAGAVVSLPDYAGTPAWYKEPDYQYFSTAHWHPIANGYSRAEPPGFRERMERYQRFPEPSALAAMRENGLRYVVVHADQYPEGPSAVERARANLRCRLLAQFGADYLFAVDE